MQDDPRVGDVHLGLAVHAEDLDEVLSEVPLELIATLLGVGEVRAELGPERLPRDRRTPSEIAHAVGEPAVDVQAQRRATERAQGPEVDRHWVAHDLVEEVTGELDRRGEQWLCTGIIPGGVP